MKLVIKSTMPFFSKQNLFLSYVMLNWKMENYDPGNAC